MQMRLPAASFAAVLAAELLVIGVAVQLRSVQTKSTEQYFTYDYSQQGEDWAAGSCADRSAQSPIDLPDQAPILQPFSYKYKPITEPFELINNGHTYAADLSGLGYGGLAYNGAWYNLMNINVHSLSEHTWAGKRHPLELHMVHKHYSEDHLIIVAVAVEGPTPILPAQQGFLQANASAGGLRRALRTGAPAPAFATAFAPAPGPAPGPSPAPAVPHFGPGFYEPPPSGDADFNPSLQAFLKVRPPGVNMKASVPASVKEPIELNSFLDSATFYDYSGSLSAPPCSEGVTWLVRKDAMKASQKQVLYLHDAVYKSNADFGNFRAVMPLNGREVSLRQGTLEDPPKEPKLSVPMPGNPQQTDREFRAMKWSKDAMTIASSASNYIKDLDQRMRNAAQAHAEALESRLDPLTIDQAAELASPPVTQFVPPPVAMETAAQAMSGALREAAAEEIDAATHQITDQAKIAAMEAARQAAGLVASGQGDLQVMANNVVTPRPVAMFEETFHFVSPPVHQ